MFYASEKLEVQDQALGCDREPSLGALPLKDGICFSVWAPDAKAVEVHFANSSRRPSPLTKSRAGVFSGVVGAAKVGDRYQYCVDGKGPFPDPASRYQPEGVHGPSEVIDPKTFAWSDHDWRGLDANKLVVYELHVGTFSAAGTFAGVREHLADLRALGVTAIELMPVADFDGNRNWGYDGVALFAPARCYGRPDDLRALVNEAHRQGLAVILDVVYNHFGPSGNYTGVFSSHYLTPKHQSPWGAGINLDDKGSAQVRAVLPRKRAALGSRVSHGRAASGRDACAGRR